MSLQSLYIHGIDAIEARPIEGSNALEIRLTRDDSTVFDIVAFGPLRVPTVTVDNVDVNALIDAAKAALRALREAHDGDPVNLPLDVSEALDVLSDLLEGR